MNTRIDHSDEIQDNFIYQRSDLEGETSAARESVNLDRDNQLVILSALIFSNTSSMNRLKAIEYMDELVEEFRG